MLKVNTFIVGAMKAGTTSFVEVLSKHPDIYMPPVKEPHYFVNNLPSSLYQPSRFFNLDSYLDKDFPQPLHISDVKTELQYEKVFSLANGSKLLCDCSTAYIHAPESPNLIHKYNDQAKIIVLIRDPLKRAFSHYKMDLGLGRTQRNFESIMIDQIAAYHNGTLSWDTYLAMSFYKEPISRYKQLFKNVLVVDFQNFIKNVETEGKRVTDFLEISNLPKTTIEHKNKTKAIRFQSLIYMLHKVGIKDVFSKVFSQKFRQRVFGIISKEQKHSLELSNDTREKLVSIFNKESAV